MEGKDMADPIELLFAGEPRTAHSVHVKGLLPCTKQAMDGVSFRLTAALIGAPGIRCMGRLSQALAQYRDLARQAVA
jgi:hypothetical protein